ncbi:MAG: hypothetical protein LJE56_01600 [Acidiferrobacterales bacterium]|jgi:hypothetical protein|nr:hypothetical protein [Acidiferrobacterales bacterium]
MTKPRLLTFKRLRIAILLGVLAVVAGSTYYQVHAMANWSRPLIMTIYPINGTGTAAVAKYINNLKMDDFADLARFLDEEADAYNVTTTPLLNLRLGRELHSLPPAPPARQAGAFAIGKWSLDLRYWLYRHLSTFGLETRHIRMFVIYHGENNNKPLKHSFGLRKGLIGVVNAFALADQNAQNNVVIAHELLHTLGATDKYEHDGNPRFPEGYGDPRQDPLYPQEFAEIMAGRIAVSRNESEIPDSLDQTLIGEATAREIHW